MHQPIRPLVSLSGLDVGRRDVGAERAFAVSMSVRLGSALTHGLAVADLDFGDVRVEPGLQPRQLEGEAVVGISPRGVVDATSPQRRQG